MLENVFLNPGWLVLVVWGAFLVPLWYVIDVRRLRPFAERCPEPAVWPRLSVVVPARNEGAKVDAGLRSLLASDYPDLELIAVDDRSTDETGLYMDRLAATDARLRVLHIQALPENWLGKNHALHTGAARATGDYILFTDGDVLFDPGALRRAVRYTHARQLDHLCLVPDFVPGSYWENALTVYFGMLFLASAQPWLIATRFRYAYCGVGAFNLVRRESYFALGGHARLALDVLDDVDLGKLIKFSGYRQDLLLAGPEVRVRWQNSLWGVIRGLEKNGFAVFGYSLPRMLVMTSFVLLLTLLPYVGPLLQPDERAVPYLATLLLIHTSYGVSASRFGARWTLLPAFPAAALLFTFAILRSTVITLRQQGVRWRDTFYPITQLRAGRLWV